MNLTESVRVKGRVRESRRVKEARAERGYAWPNKRGSKIKVK